jgi:ABC-type amino acid transport substrate-binding protein
MDAGERAWVAAHPRVTYALASDYGPFIYTDAQGQPRGLSVDVLALIARKTGLAFEPGAPLSLPQNLELARRGGVDVVTSLRPTAERARYLDFSQAYASVPTVLVVRDRETASSLRAMAGRRVAVGAGFAVEAYVRGRYPHVGWQALRSDEEALLSLAAGTVDGVVADVASVHFILRQRAGALRALRLAGPVGFDYPFAFGYRHDAPELGAVLRRGLRAISIDERAALMARWMPRPLHDGWCGAASPPALLAGLLLLAACALGLWNWRRRPGRPGALNPATGMPERRREWRPS